MSDWLDLSNVSNLYIQSYVKGFVDISGGNLILRNNGINVEAGDISLNGRLLVQSDISSNRRLFLANDASLGGRLFVNGDVSMNGNLVIGKNITILGDLTVQEYTNSAIINTLTTNVFNISEDLSLNGRIMASSDASFGGKLNVNQAATFNSTATATGLITANGGLNTYTINANTPTTTTCNLFTNATGNIAIGSSTSKVGINTSNPQYALDVNGTMNTNNGINLSYTTPPTLTNTQIGYFVNPTGFTSTSFPNGTTTIYTVTPPAGIYIFNIDGTVNSPSIRNNTVTSIILYKAGVFVSQSARGWGDSGNFAYVDCPISVTGFVSVNGSQAVRFDLANSGLTTSMIYAVKYIRIA